MFSAIIIAVFLAIFGPIIEAVLSSKLFWKTVGGIAILFLSIGVLCTAVYYVSDYLDKPRREKAAYAQKVTADSLANIIKLQQKEQEKEAQIVREEALILQKKDAKIRGD
jgi:hypothetical protein